MIDKFMIKESAVFLGLFATLFWCVGCFNIKMRDVSGTEKYRDLIGSTFSLKSEFDVYGVKWDLRAEIPDFYKMIPSHGPGVGGPEIMPLGWLIDGTRLKLAEVWVETLTNKTVYKVEVLRPRDVKFDDILIQINNAAAFDLYSNDEYPGGAPRLNSKWFSAFEPRIR